ncbi:MAG TPA: bifunctional phosphoribosylaminoimidazolecarboxamide formyltransferase/IMP cyclohydrolase, partial [Chitinophagaceae bacterium]|nr:bifunctional phosphoribosylaminoimidazolecarboxamide formyltransferase/IMP cyclohydrolase [Chitinophagaceae bacterium]
IRAAAKNFKDLMVIAAKHSYAGLVELLKSQNGHTTPEQRREYAAKAFEVVMNYDIAINNYFNGTIIYPLNSQQSLRYGENPHQHAVFYGDLTETVTQLHGKELSYNNLVDVDAAIQLINEFPYTGEAGTDATFAVIKHTNVCGIASRPTVKECWDAGLAGDPESAFGGVLVCNAAIDKATAEAIAEIFFEVLIVPSFDGDALAVLKSKKNRILLQLNPGRKASKHLFKSVLGGTLVQDADAGNYAEWKEVGGRETTAAEKADLIFANIVCKHLKSNAIVLVKDRQLVGKGCGQTSRIDSVRQSIDKAKQFNVDLKGAVMASDAFFPFSDSVQMVHAEGITAIIQPGGSIRDKDSIEYCVQNNLAMVITGQRHFKH